MASLDPNAPAESDSGIFGLDFNVEESAIVLLPVPWDRTASYGKGTADGPRAILKASHQLDLFDSEVEKPYLAGITLLNESNEIRKLNEDAADLSAAGMRVNRFVHAETARLLAAGKIVGIIGGEHSVPFGAIQAISEEGDDFGILQIDAHCDLRRAYEGYTWSHASIMYNILENIPQVEKLVSVGIRDFCEEEFDYAKGQEDRVRLFLDSEISQLKFSGRPWSEITNKIVKTLPQSVWVSFDIDGLEPSLCPHTGTPVPGGLSFNEANFLLSEVVSSGRRIIGFDLCEVSPSASPGVSPSDEWDANVGMRILYKLCAWTLVSQGKAQCINLPNC